MGKCRLTGRIVTPGDPDYNLAREEFNTRNDLFPMIINFFTFPLAIPTVREIQA